MGLGFTDRLLVVVTLLDQGPPAHPERVVVGLGSLHDAALLHEHVLALLPHVVLVSEIMQCGNSEKKTLSIRASNKGYITFETLCQTGVNPMVSRHDIGTRTQKIGVPISYPWGQCLFSIVS